MDLVKEDLGCSVSESVKGPSTVWVAGLLFLSVVVRMSPFIPDSPQNLLKFQLEIAVIVVVIVIVVIIIIIIHGHMVLSSL
jgi:hypothetical protein